MDRGKGAPSTRGKAKTQHFPSDLFALGSKSNIVDSTKRHIPSGSGERKREGPSPSHILAKKPKLGNQPSGLGRSNNSSPTSGLSAIEQWETSALDSEPSEFLQSVIDCVQSNLLEKAGLLICGALKTLKGTKYKPDSILTTSLLLLAKMKPSLFSSDNVTQALSALLKREHQLTFKSKGNPIVPVLAANLLATGFSDSKHWPTSFIRLYVDDAVSDRLWVDQPECKGFVNNLLTGFGTKASPHVNFLAPDLSPLGLPRPDSPITISLDDDDDVTCLGGTEVSISPRYTKSFEIIEQIVLDIQANRRQTPESVTRNYLKLLTSAAGIPEVRAITTPRLEVWLQNPKLMKSAQELLLAICVNCCTQSTQDTSVIAALVKIRLKTKALLNFYPTCIRELINAHTENIRTLVTHVIFNELSTSRNPNNMAMLSVVFQCQPEQSAVLVAEVFLELLLKPEDFLRPLRVLLREIVRVLRHDINMLAFCRGLMADKRDSQAFRDFDLKDRMYCAIVDLLAHSCFLGISPAVKECANMAARGDKRDIQPLIAFHNNVATIQQEAVIWLKDQVMKIYRPSTQDYIHGVHKIMFMEQQETYYKVDMWPPESERSLILRLASECPLYETTLCTILVIGLSKDLPMNVLDALELADQLVKRSASLSSDTLNMLSASRSDLVELLLKTATYHHPEALALPAGYNPPQLAVIQAYWKAWVIMLILGAHNPTTLGEQGWSSYPTLRMLMEMCITNHFSYPPPTMPLGDNPEEWKLQESRLVQRDKEIILEYEVHLAAASTKQTITEANSRLLTQLMTMEPTAPARKPPTSVMDQLRTLNTTLRLGHLLCRSRNPDFLLKLIHKHEASQSMPWLAELVENSESSLSHLPVQCLCEFLLSSGPLDKHSKGQQLVNHLQQVLTSAQQDPTAPCEVLEYLLRRLSSKNMNSRAQAIKGLKLVLSPADATAEDESSEDFAKKNAWLLDHLPRLPHFAIMLPQIVLALRQACLVENDPACVSSYIQFLALQTVNRTIAADSLLVHDMAQLIVERSTIMNAIMPYEGCEKEKRDTFDCLLLIFQNYVNNCQQNNSDSLQWADSRDLILISWGPGVEATLHILAANAIIILLSYGPYGDKTVYNEMLDTWFPMPKAYLVDTSEDALLLPDWLRLRMIRSGVKRLVDAALDGLEFKHLILFIQSFGIPVSSVSCLLERIDNSDPSAFAEATYDKAYMLQLVHVQRRRGAVGGERFIRELRGFENVAAPPAYKCTVPTTMLSLRSSDTVSYSTATPKFSVTALSILFGEVFSPMETSATRMAAFRKLQNMLLVDAKSQQEKIHGVSIILQDLMTIKSSHESMRGFISVLDQDPTTSCFMLRLLWTQLQALPENFQKEFALDMQMFRKYITSQDPALLALFKLIAGPEEDEKKVERTEQKTVSTLLDGGDGNVGHLIDQLVSSEPDLIGPSNEQQMRMLLFGKPIKSSVNIVEACRPYLLTLLTHRTSWRRLCDLLDVLLAKFEVFYNPTPILDFLESITRNPRLWQGREKHVPKHLVAEPILNLKEHQVLCLIEYMVSEAEELLQKSNSKSDSLRPAFVDTLESRLPLLLESARKPFFEKVVLTIAEKTNDADKTKADVYTQLLVLIYFRVPDIIKYVAETDYSPVLKEAVVSDWSSSALDKMSHTLLTALTTPLFDTKDQKRIQEYEGAARKIAVFHPALVLRQLPMVSASLQGRVHLNYHVLRTRNHLNAFLQVLGLLQLLQPRVFAAEYMQPLHSLLDIYLTLFKQHGQMKDVMYILAKYVPFLQSYVSVEASLAAKYLQKNASSLRAIQRIHPNLLPLRSLLSGVLTMDNDDPEDVDGPQPVTSTAHVDLPLYPPPSIISVLSRPESETDDILPALQDLEHLSHRNPGILEVISDQIKELLLSPYSNIRNLAHTLMIRLLKHNPQHDGLTVYMRCLESGQGDIIMSAVEKLPDIVVTMQEHATILLEKAFSLAVRSNLHTGPHITKAVALLNQQQGC